jgi:hypothetical protein
MQGCNRDAFAQKIRDARSMPIAPQLRPLRQHLLRLAIHSVSLGYCQRAGSEIAKARKLAKQNPTAKKYLALVKRAKGRQSRL